MYAQLCKGLDTYILARFFIDVSSLSVQAAESLVRLHVYTQARLSNHCLNMS